MTKAEQKKLFMEFYGVTPELKKWAREKWASGTASLAPESLDYMSQELIIRKRRAEALAEAAKVLEKENGPGKAGRSKDQGNAGVHGDSRQTRAGTERRGGDSGSPPAGGTSTRLTAARRKPAGVAREFPATGASHSSEPIADTPIETFCRKVTGSPSDTGSQAACTEGDARGETESEAEAARRFGQPHYGHGRDE